MSERCRRDSPRCALVIRVPSSLDVPPTSGPLRTVSLPEPLEISGIQESRDLG